MKNKDITILTIISLIVLMVFAIFQFTFNKTYSTNNNEVDVTKIEYLTKPYSIDCKWEYTSLDGKTSLVKIHPTLFSNTSKAGIYKIKLINCNEYTPVFMTFNSLYGDIEIKVNDQILYADNSSTPFAISFTLEKTTTIEIDLKDAPEFKCGFDNSPTIGDNTSLDYYDNSYLSLTVFLIASFSLLFIIILLNNILVKFTKTDILVLICAISSISYSIFVLRSFRATFIGETNNLISKYSKLLPLINTFILICIRIILENLLKENNKFKISPTSFVFLIGLFTFPICYTLLNHNLDLFIKLFEYAFNIIIILSTGYFVIQKKNQRRTNMYDILLLIFLLFSQVVTLLSHFNILHHSNYYLNSVIILIFSLSYLILNNSNVKVKVTQELELIDLKEKIRDSEFTFLNSQIQSHFIYNTLNSIQALCYISPERAASLIENFSTYLRTRLDFNKMPELISFEDELKHIQTYLNIEKERFGNRIKYRFEINVTNFLIPPLSIQPLVENSVKHGISKKVKGGTVVIKCYEDSKNIYIEVNDDGVGFDPSKLGENQRVGTNNIRHRLGLHLKANFDISSTIGVGTNYKITIDKKNLKRQP